MYQTPTNRPPGFTLVEVLVTLVIIAIVAGISAPAILSMAPNMALKSAAQELYSNIQEAKILAIKENRNVTIRFDTPGFYYIDDDDDGVYDAGEKRTILGEDINMNGTLDAGEDFNANGRLDDNYSIGYRFTAGLKDWSPVPPGPQDCVQLEAVTFNSRGLPTLDPAPPPPATPSTPNVYIQNREGDITYAIAISVAGSVKVRKHNGTNWD